MYFGLFWLEHTADCLFPVVKTKVTEEQFAKLNDWSYGVGAFSIDASFIDII
jgi:hypothetical protein